MEEAQIPLQVSVLIVSYNRAAALRACLTALEQSAGRETFEIIVVDNGSQDGSPAVVQEFPKVTLLKLPRNFGFTKALNIGMRTAKGEFFLFLNPRTEVLAGTVEGLTAQLTADPDAVAVAPVLTTPDGQAATDIHRLPRPETLDDVVRAGKFDDAPLPEGEETATVAFAGFRALMVSNYFLTGLRYIDERYAQSWADAEIAAQIRRAGKKTLVAPKVRALWHPEDPLRDTMPEPAKALLRADWALGATEFASKHFGFGAALKLRVVAVLVALTSVRLRDFMALVSGQKIDGTQSVM